MRGQSRPDPALDPGHDTGLAQLFVAERLPMVRLAALMVGSRVIAEEIVQDAFASVSERWDRLDRPGGYLRTTVVNGCAQVLRRRSVEDRHRMVEFAIPDETTERLIELRSALDRLTERQRIVIVLRYFADLSDREIAQTLDVRPATVRSLAHRALTALRRELR